jgi:hypothetical protein
MGQVLKKQQEFVLVDELPLQKQTLASSPEANNRIGYRILQYTFVVIPLITGTDKFFHLLVNWDQYMSPLAFRMLGSHAHLFMKVAGLVEICVGIGMKFNPKVFSYFVSAWLFGIVVNLILTGSFFDIALRDLGLAMCALGLARMRRI